MSHYTTMETAFVSRDHLVAALADLGLEKVEVHDVPKKLVGWLGGRRPQTAEVIIRRRFVGMSSNDIGFARSPDGTLTALISDFDSKIYNQVWLDRLSQRYAYRAARDTLAAQGFDLVEESIDDDDKIRMTVRRMA